MTPEQWAIPQKLAAQCLEKNAEIGGPRCCKRTGRIAIECAAAFSEKEFGVAMPVSRPRCGFSPWNTECIRERCPYFGDAREARTIRRTRSVCPVCLKNLPAALVREGDGRIFLEKSCAEHGAFRTLVWSGAIDFKKWLRDERPLLPEQGLRCPGDCGLCAEHESGSCCVLLEVTRRCDLRCRFCFARGGEAADEPALDELKAAVDDIVRQCGGVLLQLSGGEPTQRDDLPELVRYAKEAGCSYVQLNTNGLRLAREPDYAARLAAAGLDIVFLQFDGTREDIYETLRGAPLLAQKKKAIEVCGELRLGVTLVPTVVRGVNSASWCGWPSRSRPPCAASISSPCPTSAAIPRCRTGRSAIRSIGSCVTSPTRRASRSGASCPRAATIRSAASTRITSSGRTAHCGR